MFIYLFELKTLAKSACPIATKNDPGSTLEIAVSVQNMDFLRRKSTPAGARSGPELSILMEILRRLLTEIDEF